MKPISIAIALTLAAATTSTLADDYKVGALEIDHPWARATPKGAKTAAGYMVIKNTGTTPDRLVGGSLAVAGSVEVHQMTMQGGVMKMRPVAGGLEIKPGETLELKPESYHVMFMDLKAPLMKGQPVKGTLSFEKAGSVDVEYAVEAIGAKGAGRMDHMQMH